MKIEDEIHCIKPKYGGKIETIQLRELFDSFNIEGIKQIIRFNEKIFSVLNKEIENREISLFNRVNPNVNSKLIDLFNSIDNREKYNKALIIEIENNLISGKLIPVLKESSIKVVKVLEMDDLYIENIKKNGIYKNSISKPDNFEEFKEWFIKDFESGRLSSIEFDSFGQLFYRKIKKF